jgi:tRNA pseudouridine38-40 synthase
MEKRVLLVVAYDGTNYHGWQIQPNGITIESELNRCLSELVGEPIQVSGASRTDSGVHALGNLAIFDTKSRIPGEKFSYALNQRLPEDIRIQESYEVPLDFHPRKTATKKTYEYRITCAPFPIPTKRLYAHYTYHNPDVGAMQEAARYLIGEHDFQSFCSVGNQTETTVRTIYDLQVSCEQIAGRNSVGTCPAAGTKDIVIRVQGNGFLYNMVRIIAGTLLDVGLGRKTCEDIPKILETCNREAAGPTAPARGLTLIGYEFVENQGKIKQKDIDTPGNV